MNHEKQFYLERPIVVCVLAILCCLLWGSATPCIKTGYRLFSIQSTDVGSVLLFAGMRFTLAGIFTIVVTSIISKKILIPQKKNIFHVMELGTVQTVIQYFFFYLGLAHASGVNSCIVQGINVFIALLVASLIFHLEKLTLSKIFGCFLGFAGILLVNLFGKNAAIGGFSFYGEGFVIISIVAYSFSSVMMKRFSKTELPYTLSGYQFLFGGLVLMLVGVCMGGKVRGFTLISTMLLIYMAFLSAVAYTIWGLLLTYNPVGKVTVYSCCTPIFGVIMSAFFLKEAGQASVWIITLALVLICVGITIVNRSKE